MKTVGEFKKAGLVFVEGDTVVNEGVTVSEVMRKSHAEAVNFKLSNITALNFDVKEFAWRENTGVKPEFVGQIEWVGDSDFVYVNRSDELIWSGKCIAKWRPRLNQPQKWPDNSRIDSIGQNGNDGLHYDNTAQQVEALAVNNKSIFTQAMVDVSVGFKLKFTHEIDGKFKHLHSEKYGWEDGDDLEVIHITENHNGETCFIVLNCQTDVLNTAAIVDISFFDTRTPKQKAIDAALHEWPASDKATLEIAYDFWRVGESTIYDW